MYTLRAGFALAKITWRRSRRRSRGKLFAFALVTGLFPFTLPVRAQSTIRQLMPWDQQTAQANVTFIGEIVKAQNGAYALLTDPQA